MIRRAIALILTLALALLTAPLAAEAQAGKVYRVGVLQATPTTPTVNPIEAFRQGLREHGYIEGQNIVIEHQVSRAPKDNPALLSDLLDRKIDVLVTWSTPALVAAKKTTSTIPIVGISGDPVRTGLVASLARPGGNLTGLAILTDELELNLQLLKEAGRNLKEVQELLGHRTFAMTLRYAILSPDQLREAVASLPVVSTKSAQSPGNAPERSVNSR